MSDFPQPLPMLRVPGWERVPRLVHGFCGRRGGGSEGAFAELNVSLAVGDDPEAVRENWRRLGENLGRGVRFRKMHQRHGDGCVVVDGHGSEEPEADALITAASGLALCVLTADCVPLLLVAPERRVVAAVHAGWRGTRLGIARRAVRVIRQRFGVPPAALHAALGPSIGACCYQVDREIADDIERRWGAMPETVRPDGCKRWLDLRAINRTLLTSLGIPPGQIATIGPCTRCAGDAYFSYRAVCQSEARGTTGRQVSFIGWSA
ncbi:MAG: peptidoglycan editing factor PgeF [Candidatus Binatia bacterium]